MFTTLKIAGLSAVLAAGLVAASMPTGASVPAVTASLPPALAGQHPRTAPAPTRAAPETESLRDQPADPCAKAAWPYVPRDCIADARRPVRTIAIDSRDAAGRPAPARVASR